MDCSFFQICVNFTLLSALFILDPFWFLLDITLIGCIHWVPSVQTFFMWNLKAKWQPKFPPSSPSLMWQVLAVFLSLESVFLVGSLSRRKRTASKKKKKHLWLDLQQYNHCNAETFLSFFAGSLSNPRIVLDNHVHLIQYNLFLLFPSRNSLT